MPTRRLLCAVLLGTGIAPIHANAQATRDEARLTLGVSLGAVTGADLWSVSPQAIQFTTPTDSFGISRRIRSNLVVGFGGTYFSSETFGIAVEGFLIGQASRTTVATCSPQARATSQRSASRSKAARSPPAR